MQDASPRLRCEREVVMRAVRGNGLALEFAAPLLRRERDVVVAAVGQNSRALLYAAVELREDAEVMAAMDVSAVKRRRTGSSG